MQKVIAYSGKYRVDCLRLRSIIILRGYNLSSFAKNTGISVSALHYLLRGNPPTCSMMCRIVNGLNLTPAEAIEIFFAAILPIT